MYFDAGKKEEEYNAAQGSANLVKSAELFAEVLVDKGHTVIDGCVHVIPGGHHNMTWMRNLADAARSVHPTSPMLSEEQTHHTDEAVAVEIESHTSPETTRRYRNIVQTMRNTEPGYMAPTESSQEKEREKYTPFLTTPKPPWKP